MLSSKACSTQLLLGISSSYTVPTYFSCIVVVSLCYKLFCPYTHINRRCLSLCVCVCVHMHNTCKGRRLAATALRLSAFPSSVYAMWCHAHLSLSRAHFIFNSFQSTSTPASAAVAVAAASASTSASFHLPLVCIVNWVPLPLPPALALPPSTLSLCITARSHPLISQ